MLHPSGFAYVLPCPRPPGGKAPLSSHAGLIPVLPGPSADPLEEVAAINTLKIVKAK